MFSFTRVIVVMMSLHSNRTLTKQELGARFPRALDPDFNGDIHHKHRKQTAEFKIVKHDGKHHKGSNRVQSEGSFNPM